MYSNICRRIRNNYIDDNECVRRFWRGSITGGVMVECAIAFPLYDFYDDFFLNNPYDGCVGWMSDKRYPTWIWHDRLIMDDTRSCTPTFVDA